MLLVLKIIGFECGTTNSLNLEKNSFNETSPRFNISLREIFFKASSARVMEKHDESALMEILQEFEIR